MDRGVVEAFQVGARRAVLDKHTAFLDGFVAALSYVAGVHADGLLTDEWVQEVRDHVALHREFSA